MIGSPDRSGGAERGELIKNTRVLVVRFVFDKVAPAHGYMRVLGDEKRLESCLFDSRCQLGNANAAIGQPDRDSQFHGIRNPSLT
jgi:hypothetical protein